jgi:predicted ATPase/class 3 adenylate cyclase
MHDLPGGTVTFLYTDIEGSTIRWEHHPDAMKAAVERHDAIVRRAIEAQGGYVFRTEGDAFRAVFTNPTRALAAALQAQRALSAEAWAPDIAPMRVRMALHTGTAEMVEGDYVGPSINRIARLLSAAHGGQTLLSLTAEELLRDTLPLGVSLLDMGEHRLRDLAHPERIFQLLHPDLPSEFPPLKTVESRPNNLPIQPNRLIGREQEVEAVKSRLQRKDTGLLTLTGPGGIGKTRLALQAAAEMLDDFEGGVFFINLAPLVDPGLVIPTTAYTLGLREGGGQPIEETLKEYLKDKRLLLVLDNFEQVVEAASSVAELLKSAPYTKVLATSRASLDLSIEHEYLVPPLPVPDLTKPPSLESLSQYDAVKLFIQRAQEVKPDFEVNTQNAAAVAEICYRLEGIPLAIELAATRVKVLSPHAILDRLGSKLKLLTGGARDLPTRQQTLRNTIEWSYDLLTEGEKQLFRRASVFRGGRTLEAVEEVCNSAGDLEIDVLDGITSLVGKSLMFTVEGAEHETRYSMLETICEYATEKLDESTGPRRGTGPQRGSEGEEIRRQHALYLMRLAERAEPELRGIRQGEWLARLEDDHDNMRAALRWAGESGDPAAIEAGLRLAGALSRFWQVRGYLSEGREQLARFVGLLERETDEARTNLLPYSARALHGAGVLAHAQGDYSAAHTLYEESLALRRELGDRSGIASSLNNLGVVAQEQGDYAAARTLHEESLALKRELGDRSGIAYSLTNLGVVAKEQGDYAAARTLHEESLALFRELGDKRSIASSLTNLGVVAHAQGDPTSARALHEESLALFRELGDKRSTAISLNNLGTAAHEQGDYASSRTLYKESLVLCTELGDKVGIIASLAGLGGLAVGTGGGEVERGARALGAVEALSESTGAVLEAADRSLYERNITEARAQLGEETFERTWAEGRAMSMEEAIKYALEGNL